MTDEKITPEQAAEPGLDDRSRPQGWVRLEGLALTPNPQSIRFVRTPGGDFYEFWVPGQASALRYHAEQFDGALHEARKIPYREAAIGVPFDSI